MNRTKPLMYDCIETADKIHKTLLPHADIHSKIVNKNKIPNILSFLQNTKAVWNATRVHLEWQGGHTHEYILTKIHDNAYLITDSYVNVRGLTITYLTKQELMSVYCKHSYFSGRCEGKELKPVPLACWILPII